MPDWLIQLAIVTAVGVLGWFLRQKDSQQQKELNDLKAMFDEKCAFQQKQVGLLFQKHDEDAHALGDLKLKIASDHYVKQELDAKFDRLETALKQGMGELSSELKSMGSKFEGLAHQLLTIVGNGKK